MTPKFSIPTPTCIDFERDLFFVGIELRGGAGVCVEVCVFVSVPVPVFVSVPVPVSVSVFVPVDVDLGLGTGTGFMSRLGLAVEIASALALSWKKSTVYINTHATVKTTKTISEVSVHFRAGVISATCRGEGHKTRV